MNTLNNRSRRKFLLNLAKAGALLPFAGQLLGQNAFAQTTGGAKRVLFMYHPNGVPPVSWNPAEGITSIAARSQELSFCLAPLVPWHNKIVVLKNIYIDIEAQGGGIGGGHTNAQQGVLTGNYNISSSSASIDHLIAKRLNELNSGIPAQDVLSLGVRTGNSGNLMISKPFNEGSASRAIPNNNPRDVAQKLAAKVTDTPVTDAQKIIYDAVLADFNDLSSAALEGVRKEKINLHLSALQRLRNQSNVGVGNVPFNLSAIQDTASGTLTLDQKWQFPLLARAQVDNIVAAFANGLHRVATLQLATGNEHSNWAHYGFDECWAMNQLAKQQMSGLALIQRDYGEHSAHGPSHNFGQTAVHAQTRWYNAMLAYTLDQLNKAGILDDTLVVMFAETGDSSAHVNSSGSIVVAGGAGTSLPMGRVITCGTGKEGERNKGTHHLFGDIARLTGVTTGLQESYWTGGVLG